MSLKDLNLKRSYDSYGDNIESFFNSTLEESNCYLRAAAYFSSASLKVLSRGLSHFIAKSGQIKMIVSVVVSEIDVQAINNGILDKSKVVNDLFSDTRIIESLTGRDSAKALYELILSGKLEMRFVISEVGIFHMKFGIIKDQDGNAISFSGSLNETGEGYVSNGEEFKVFRSWISGENYYVQDDLEKFHNYWKGSFPRNGIIVSNLPGETTQRIHHVVSRIIQLPSMALPELRAYQLIAIQKWEKNGFKGIIEMATGTGKTRVALEIIKNISIKYPGVIIIISVPTRGLLKQWIQTLSESHLCKPIEANSENMKTILKEIDKVTWANHEKSTIALVGTYAYFSGKTFREKLDLKDYPILFISDEVHTAGSPVFSRALNSNYKFRLGLSATPSRYFDDEGTNFIMEYFGGIVFTYTLKDGITDTFLSPFNYFPKFASLLSEEVDEYKRLTRKYSSSTHGEREFLTRESKKELQLVLFLRAKVVKKAANKLKEVEEILADLIEKRDIAHTLIYYEDTEQIGDSIYVLDQKNIKYGIISADTVDEQRNSLIGKFDKGEIDCLCSMKVMDEGIDIPSVRNEIILSSSGNPRQIVQRIGRALRKFPGKDGAKIFEVSAIAPEHALDSAIDNIERRIVEKEIKRMIYIAKASSNELHCYDIFEEIGKRFEINIWEYL